ncbi:MAG: SUMF1/EgtB/PvdO family nonheme iron enzyme [Salinivirgaceae bacterium]|nr:SUMF1/EgtB/PvdO family nonheme iron enzyme [Salinivirgaceae bacterium]
MRKLFSTLMLIALLAIVPAGAMAQNSFSYQSVIRNNGQVASNQDVALLISILSGNDVCYQEVQKVKTNAYGNISISVGEGEPKTGSFAAIPWESMNVMMQIEVSTDGTENYVNLGQMQIQPVPYTMYAARTTTVIQPKEASEDPIFEVRDSEGELLFAVYETGVKVFVDGNDNQNGKAAKSKFAVAGQSGSKGERNLLTIDADGTTVYVDENTNTDANKAAKSRFAVAGQSGKDFNNLLTIDGSGATIYVDENTDTDANKAAKSRFAVAGQSGKDGGNLLTIDAEGTTVYVDENTNTDANKAAKSRFAVAGQSGKAVNNRLTIDGSGTTIYVDENTNTDANKAAKSRFAVAGQSGGKANGNLFTIDGDGSTVYVDFNTSDKAAKSRFAVAGQSGKGIENALTIDGDQATFYIDVDDDTNTDDNAKAAKSRFAVAGQSGKDVQTAFVVDGSGTIIYIDEWDDASKAAKSTFAVAGLSSQKANSNFFIINRDSTRIYVNDQPQTADTTGTEPGSAPVVAPSLASAFAVIGMTQKTDMIVVNRDSTIVKMNTYVEEEVQNSTGKVEKIIDDSKPKTICTTGQIAAIALKGNDEVGDSYTITYAYYQSDNGEYLHLKYCDDYNNYQYRNYYLIDNVLYADSIFMSSAVSEFAIAPEHYTQPAKSDTSLLMVYERKMRNNGYSSFLEDGQTTFYDSEENLVMTTEHNVLMAVDNGKLFIDTTLQNILVQGMIKAGGAPYERNDLVKLQLSNGQLYDNEADFDNCNEDVFGSEEERNKLTVAQIESWFAALKAGFAVKGLANNDVYGEVRFSENKERYAYGETLTLTADAKEGYIFTCWSDGLPDKERSVIVAGEASYQAIFEQPVLYVSGSKNAKNDNYGFTIAEPLATLAAAASIIVEAEPTDLKWTIRVDSAVTGLQTLPADLNDHASSITIEGYRGINRDGVPQDTLNGNNEGTTLTINTAVPVTIENLMITKGYAEEANGGGIYISEGATVTLAGGACISGNRATPIIENNQPVNGKGGGVYTAGTLVIDGGVVGDKNAKNNATNTDYSNYANRGGGIYFSNTGKVTVKEGAVIAYNFGYQGGGISTYEIGDAELTIDGGEIRYNGCDPKPQQATASNKFNSYGGGLFLVGCKFVLSGGSIHHNFGCDGGGGLFLQATDSATMSGGSIHNNTWDEEGYKFGSDVLLYDGCTLSMTSGSIYADNAVSIGVMSRTSATSLKMRGDATISQNTPVYLVDGTYINITGPLTAGIAAIITPQTYANNRTVLVLADSVKKSTTLAAEVGKFRLASADWRIIADGKMLKSDFVSVQGTYFDGSQRVDTSHVFIVGRKLAIHNLYACDHEVTQGEYVAVMGTNPSNNPSGDNYPVEQVSWLGAINYCNSRSAAENLTQCYTIDNNTVTCNFDANGYRLPTEAEWEYLARGGELTGPQMAFSGSSSPDGVAWYSGNSGNKTHEVKTKEKNSLDLYDMCGNVWEWCWDYYNSITSSTPATGPESANANYHCERGGWYGTSSEYCEVGNRQSNAPTYSDTRSGFRVVRTAVITDSVTITFNTNDGEAVEPMKVWRGYRHNELPTPKKGTLNFGGWYTNSDCQTPFVVGGAITSDTTLYAKWLSDFIEVPGTYFDGAEAMANSVVFVKDTQIVIRDLYACDHEVTQKEWFDVMKVTQEQLFAADSGRGPNCPVYNINWYEAIAYCNKLSLKNNLEPVYSVNGVTNWLGLDYADIPTTDNADWNAAVADYDKNGYRLPTEAEWEYLARGGSNWDSYQYSGSNSIDSVAWNNYNSAVNGKIKMHEVKTKKANSLGLYDMSGSAWEWCSDWMDDASLNVRGGSVKCNPLEYSHNDWCNVKSRGGNAPYDKTWHFGFRVVRTAKPLYAVVGGVMYPDSASTIAAILGATDSIGVVLTSAVSAAALGNASTEGTIINAIKNNSNENAKFSLVVPKVANIVLTGEDCKDMFFLCQKLVSADLRGINTEGVTDMSSMFFKCSLLTTLDLSRLNTDNATNMNLMFNGCSALTTIYAALGANWSASTKLENSSSMFSECNSLKGGNGTKCDTSNVKDATRARIDGLNGQPGYFTLKPMSYYVNPNKNGAGLSADDALPTLAAALSKIVENDNPSLNYTIYISGTLNGPQTLPADLNGKASSITLCGLNGLDGYGVPQDKLVGYKSSTELTVSTTVPVTIRKLQITKGYDTNGGGINMCSGSHVTLSFGALVGEAATSVATESSYGNQGKRGGGIYNGGGNLILGDGSMVCHNYASVSYSEGEAGAGISCYGGTITVMAGAKVMYNYSSARGGGIALYDGAELYISGGNIDNNEAKGWGGGVFFSNNGDNPASTKMVMTGGSVSGNSVTGKVSNRNESGGGIYIDCGTVTISGNAQINNNSATVQGGGVGIGSGTFDMHGGILSGNTVEERGGAISYNSAGAYFQIGDSAYIPCSGLKQNDVWLPQSGTIKVTSELKHTAPVATITPASYTTTPVLSVANGVSLEDNAGRFAVTPNGNTLWAISDEGYLTQTINSASSLHSAINSVNASGISTTISLSENITLTRGFSGKDANHKINISGNEYYRISIQSETNDIVIKNVNFEEGYALSDCGGMLKLIGKDLQEDDEMEPAENLPSLTIENCTFRNCDASGSWGNDGGALYVRGYGKMSVKNSTFEITNGSSQETTSGGFIAAFLHKTQGLELTIEGCSFSGGMASFGGAMNLHAPDDVIVTIDNCTFTGNKAKSGGTAGAIDFFSSGKLNISNCSFTNNQGQWVDVDGDSYLANNVFLRGGQGILTNCTVDGVVVNETKNGAF